MVFLTSRSHVYIERVGVVALLINSSSPMNRQNGSLKIFSSVPTMLIGTNADGPGYSQFTTLLSKI